MNNSYLSKYLTLNLRACQLKQLSILEEIDRICDKYKITYWLDGGSLLGAVRHKGFIPWDDDIDIAMTEKDLKEFIQIAPSELPKQLFLQTPQSDPHCKEPIIKVRDLNSFYVENSDVFSTDYQKGLFVDIFPFIDYPNLPKRWVKILGKGISTSYSILHSQHYYSFRSVSEFFYFGFKYYVFKGLWNILKQTHKNGTYMSNILINNGYGIMHRKDSIFPVTNIVFEGKIFKSPADPDAYLKDLYKNYMDVPPIEKRKIHATYIHPELCEL